MKRVLLLLLFFLNTFLRTTQIYASEERQKGLPLSDTNGGSATLVNGCVSVISGDYLQAEIDIVLRGPEPIIFERLYSSSDYGASVLYSGWRHNHEDSVEPWPRNDEFVDYTDTSGRTAVYKGSKHSKYCPKHSKGFANFGAGVYSGQNHLKNIAIDRKKDGFWVKLGDGTQKYLKEVAGTMRNQWHKKPHNTEIRYSYDKEGDLTTIEALNNATHQVFSYLKISDVPRKQMKEDPQFKIKASDGRKITYKLQKFKADKKHKISQQYRIQEVISTHAPKESYEYSERDGVPGAYMTKKIRPDGRFLEIVYYTREDKIDNIKLDKKDYRLNRVKLLKAPVGHDNLPINLYRFVYEAKFKKKINHGDIQGGKTSVYDAYNHKTAYHYDEEDRLTKIEKFLDNGALYSFENYVWDEESNLIRQSLSEGNGNLLAVRNYTYDKHCNLVGEVFSGNLKGTGTSDKWTVEYTYTKDGKNLLSEQKESNGKTTQFIYYPGTDRIKEKYVLENGAIKFRSFYEYDGNSVLACEINDDGNQYDRNNLTGVNQRKITRFWNRQAAPFGLPERIDENYLDLATGQECLLKRIINHYNGEGHVVRQQHYDSQGAPKFDLWWEYNAHGKIILERNALGETIERAYDKNDNLTFERGYRKDNFKQFEYDFSNRLVATRETHSDGVVLSNTHDYSFLSQEVGRVDAFGQKVENTYDELGRPTLTKLPIFFDEGRFVSPQIQQQYDVLGNVTSSIDPLGRTTHKQYNVRGQATLIVYPDGTSESFIYNEDGTLKESVAKNGVITGYKYDCFGRLWQKDLYSPQRKLLSTTSAVYSGFNKVSETDAEGHVTHYRYDFAGRLIAVSKADSLTEYEYDTWGRVARTKEWDTESSYKIKISLYDALDRVIEERDESHLGEVLSKVNYVYDADGNRIEIIRYNQAGKSITRTEYNSRKQPTKIIDPEGNATLFAYNYQAQNKYGQAILETTITDPMGIQTITQMNVFGKTAKICKKNSLGCLLAEKEVVYDAAGNKVRTIELAILEGQTKRQVITQWTYNAADQLVSLIEACGTLDQKVTQYVYNNFGQKQAIIKPDGIRVVYEYDVLGRLKHFYATDASLDYVYEYDRNDNMVSSTDLIHSQVTRRHYDESNRMVSEQLGNGYKIDYSYDRMGRVVNLKFPYDGAVVYEYDAIRLKKAAREVNGKVVYEHTYDTFDLSGNLLEATLPGNLGEALFGYDLNNRLLNMKGAAWHENVSYDQVGNLVGYSMKHANQALDAKFAYDDLYQLKKEDGLEQHKYDHDSLNNCVEKDGQQQTFDALNQLLSGLSGEYGHDRNGNRIKHKSICGQEYVYKFDALDRLIECEVDGRQVKYTYDSFNRRLSKQTQGTLINYIYVGQNEVGSFDESQKLLDFRVLGTGRGAEIGATVAMEIMGTIYVPQHDHNGNVIMLMDLKGAIVEKYLYTAFGEEGIYDGSGHEVFETQVGNAWRFSSKRVDVETGFINFGRRCYDPRTSRWISPDPLGFETGPNLYAYVMNSPLCHIDLYGLAARQSTSSGFGSSLQSFANQAWQFPGRAIEFAGFHLMPLRAAQDAVMSVGRVLMPRDSWNKNYDYEKPQWLGSFGNGEKSITTRYLFWNGILNFREDAIKTANEVANFYNRKVDLLYFPSQGFVQDLMECGALMMGVETQSVMFARKEMGRFLEEVGSEGTLENLLHSRAGLIGYRTFQGFPDEDLSRINVETFGTAKIVDDKKLGKAKNNISYLDLVTMFGDPKGYFEALIFSNEHVEFIKSNGYPLLDHAILSDVYKDKISEIGFLINQQ